MLARQLQQLLPAPGWQADRGRELVMGRYVHHPHLVLPAQGIELVDPATLMVQLHGHQAGTQLTEDLPGRG